MKLVPIKYDTGTPSLGRGSLEAATAEGRGMAAMAGAVQDLAVDVAQKYRRHQVENSTAELELELSQWKKQHAEKQFYDSTEVSNLEGIRLTEDIVDAKGEMQTVPRHEIPAHEVQSQLYERYASNLIKSKGGKIEWSMDRNLWESKMNTVLNEQTAANRVRDIAMRDKAVVEQAMQNFDNAMEAQNYTAAIGIINTADVPAEKKVEMRQTVYEREERDGLDNYLVENRRVDLERGMAILTDEKEYDRNGGNLSDAERLGYARNFRAALNALDAKDATAITANATRVNRRGRQMIKAIKSTYGHKINPLSVTNLMEDLIALGPKGEAVLEELYLSHMTMESRQAFKLRSPTERAQELKNMEDELAGIENPSPEQLLIFEALRETHEEATVAQNKDPLQFSIDSGRVDTQPLPKTKNGKVSFRQSNDWAEDRMLDRDAATAHFGTKTGLLTKEETTAIIGQMEEASASEKVMFITDAVNSFGMDEAKQLFTQLGMEKDSGAWAHIGSIAANDMQAAKNILRGKDIRADIKGIIKNETMDYIPEIMNKIGGTTAYFNTNTRSSVQSAILDAYAYLADRDNALDGDYNENRMEEAIAMSTGGLMEFNDVMVQRPDPDVTADDFEGWMEEVSPEYITQLGGVHGYQDQDIVDHINSGRIILLSHGDGTNEYMIRDTNTGNVLMTPGGESPFTFKYDSDAPKMEIVTPAYRAGRRYGGSN